MLTAFRNFAKSPAATVLFVLLILAMAGFGVSQYGFSAIKGDEVVRAGPRVVTSLDFRREYDQQKKRFEEQQGGQPITPEVAAQNKLDAIILNGLAVREGFAALLDKIGVRPSDKLVLDQIKEIPAFFDPVSGRFDRKTFEQRLGENQLTPALFDQQIRDQMATQHLVTGLGNGLKAPRAYGALAAIYGLESRDVAYFELSATTLGAPPTPTDAQLVALMNQYKDQLTRPESRVLTVVRFAPDPNGATGPIDPAELQKRYDFRKDTFSKPETRSLVQIAAKSPQAAQQIVTRLGKGEAPEAVAKAVGVEAIIHQDKPQTAIPDRKLAQAVFGLQAGQVSTVQGDLGLAVVKILSISPGRTVSLDEARPMLEAEIRKDQSVEKVYNMTQVYDDARQAGAGLADAAAKAGVAPVTAGPVSAQGLVQSGAPAAGLTPRIVETAFTLPAGGESDLIDAGQGEYFAVRVDRIIPAALPPMAELRPILAQEWVRRETARRLETKAGELVERIRKGEALEAVAASIGAQPARAAGLSRQTAQGATLPPEVLGQAFSRRPGEVFTAPLANGQSVAIGRAENVRMAADPMIGQIAEAQRNGLTQEIFKDLGQAAQTYARVKMKVRTDPVRARAAAGLPEPEVAAPAKKK